MDKLDSELRVLVVIIEDDDFVEVDSEVEWLAEAEEVDLNVLVPVELVSTEILVERVEKLLVDGL